MGKRSVRGVTIAALLVACSGAVGVEQGGANDLLSMYPGARLYSDGARIVSFYGAPMTPGLDAQGAANAWVKQHGAAFGVGELELTETWTTTLRQGRFTAINFDQTIAGIPVEFGDLRVLVLNGPVPRVVYAGGNIAAQPANLNGARIGGVVATTMARTNPGAKGLDQWSEPELIIFQGDGDFVAPHVAYRIRGSAADPRTAKRFYVSASTGQVLHVSPDVHYLDVNGAVNAMRSPSVHPDAAYNPPALLPVPEFRVTLSGGNSSFTDANGNFTIVHGGSSPVNLLTGTGTSVSGGGRWSNLTSASGPIVAATANGVTPPGPGNMTLNATPTADGTAQVNAVTVANMTHTYFKDRAPGFTALDIAITTRTGVSGTCNAFFQPSDLSINFYNAGGGCPNTAYSTVASHEYGHFIVNRLGRSQNSFGEGYGDTTASMIWDDRATGRGFFGTQNVPLRDPIAANIQYPCSASCSNQIHCCGQQLPAAWWRIRTNLGTLMGNVPGLEETRDLQVAWSLITAGGPNASNAIGPSTAIEVLTVDDNDGNLNNGTPHYTEICSAFAAGAVQCPALQLITFTYPGGRPTTLTPNQPMSFQVTVTGLNGTPQAGTGTLSYRVAPTTTFTTVSMTENAPNQYTATLPATACPNTLEWYVSANAIGGTPQRDPVNAPASFYNAFVGGVVVADLTMQSDPGWTVTNTSVTTGAWERADPHTPASSGCPAADSDGSGLCWVTDNRAGDNPNFDLDGGPTVLTTGVYDLSAYSGANVSFSRWLTSVNGAVDSMLFQYSLNNGGTWTTLQTLGANAGSWVNHAYSVPNPTAQTRFRWSLTDNPSDSVTEAGVDAFKLIGFNCNPTVCYANCDGSTAEPTLNVADFTCFLQRFAAGESYANCDGSTTAPVLNVADFTCFLQSFAGGCP